MSAGIKSETRTDVIVANRHLKMFSPFYNKKYVFNNPGGLTLDLYDIVFVNSKGLKSPRLAFINFIDDGIEIRYTVVGLETSISGFIARLDDEMFKKLEPLSWWKGNNRTVKSEPFKVMCQMLGIDASVYKHLP